MTDEQPQTYRLLELLKPVALVVLTVNSGIVVWSFHNFEWMGFLLYLVVGFVLGSVAGGLVGLRLSSTWAVMAMTGGLFEGVFRGWLYYGWIGAVLGGLSGVVVGIIVAILLTMLMCLALVICGIDPFVSAGTEKEQETDAD